MGQPGSRERLACEADVTLLAIFYLGVFCGVMGLGAAEILFRFSVLEWLSRDDSHDNR
jgi:hypothetical protein